MNDKEITDAVSEFQPWYKMTALKVQSAMVAFATAVAQPFVWLVNKIDKTRFFDKFSK